MFAVVKTGGKQYRIEKGSVIKVEKLEANVGESFKLNDVLMLGKDGKVMIGSPFVANATVEAQVLSQIKDKKVLIFKKKRRHNYRRKKGHRQNLTILKITDILAG